MDALSKIAREIEQEPSAMQSFVVSDLPRAETGAVFVGAGDSYAAAVVGFYASEGRCLALDPYTLATDPGFAKGRDIHFISVSGRTASNLRAADRVRLQAKSTTALTSVGDSPLSKKVSRTIEIPFSYAPKTSGMLSFCLSALAVLKMVGADPKARFGEILKEAKKSAHTMLRGNGTTFILGNHLAFPAALYAAAKSYELVGVNAHAELLEEFSHLELFALRKTDSVNAFGSFDRMRLGRKLARTLRRNGYQCSVVPDRGISEAGRFFHSVFTAQVWALQEARRAGLSEPMFLKSRERLKTSDAMIY